MIVTWFLGVATGVLEWLTSSLPTLDVPSWVDPGVSDAIGLVTPFMAGTGAWFPLPLMGLIIAAWAIALAVGIGIKVARMVLSLLTAGGGSAA